MTKFHKGKQSLQSTNLARIIAAVPDTRGAGWSTTCRQRAMGLFPPGASKELLRYSCNASL